MRGRKAREKRRLGEECRGDDRLGGRSWDFTEIRRIAIYAHLDSRVELGIVFREVRGVAYERSTSDGIDH